VLSQETRETAFAPEIATAQDARAWGVAAVKRLQEAFEVLAHRGQWERTEDQEHATDLLAQKQRLKHAIEALARSGVGSPKIRIHGDFHLGQILVASGDAFIIDFEGEPARSLPERRAKTSPLRDVAGLLRSIDYAAAARIEQKGVGAVPVSDQQKGALIAQFRERASRAFLNGYHAAAETASDHRERRLLDLFLLEKAAYEITYEANNRPTWIAVPMAGLGAIAARVLEELADVDHD
jgi:maltose alpha-D-glucosyltransferase / alpha-amylase